MSTPALPILYLSILDPCPICDAEWKWDLSVSPPVYHQKGLERESDVVYCSTCGFAYIESTKSYHIPSTLSILKRMRP